MDTSSGMSDIIFSRLFEKLKLFSLIFWQWVDTQALPNNGRQIDLF